MLAVCPARSESQIDTNCQDYREQVAARITSDGITVSADATSVTGLNPPL